MWHILIRIFLQNHIIINDKQKLGAMNGIMGTSDIVPRLPSFSINQKKCL